MTEVSLESLNALLAAGEKLKRLLQDKATAEKAVEILDKLIIEAAAELVEIGTGDEEKSEMPCNCHCDEENTLAKIIAKTVQRIADNNHSAVIIVDRKVFEGRN